MPEPEPRRPSPLREPQFLIAIVVGIAVLLFFLWRAPEFDGVFAERPDVPIGRPEATPFPSFTPGASPTFGPTATPRPPTATPPPAAGAAERDIQRREHLDVIAQAAQAYFDDNGSFPQTGANAQSLCVFPDLDAGCDLREYAPGGELPSNPLGEPYQYRSVDGTSWIVFAELELDVPAADRCVDPSVELFPRRNKLICVAGGAP